MKNISAKNLLDAVDLKHICVIHNPLSAAELNFLESEVSK